MGGVRLESVGCRASIIPKTDPDHPAYARGAAAGRLALRGRVVRAEYLKPGPILDLVDITLSEALG
jgi:hypothetical protein